MDAAPPLLQDIFANPHDDTPRLVLADWVEEEGGEEWRSLGEFIRVQYALESMHPGNPRRASLEKLQAMLLPAQLERWKEALEGLYDPRPVFRRGFLEGVTVPLTLLDTLPARCDAGLALRSLALLHWPEQSARPQRRRDTALEEAAGSPLLEQLEILDLSGVTFPDDNARRAWMRSPRLRRLRCLRMSGEPEMLSELFDSPLRQQLHELRLHDPGERSRGADWTGIKRAALPELRTLAVPAFLSAYPNFRGLLAGLDIPALSRVELQPFDGRLTRAAALPSLLLARVREIDLAGAPPDSLTLLEGLPSLETLSVARCGLSAETVHFLANLPPPPLLWSLDVSTNGLGDAGAATLARSAIFREARSLRMSYCGMKLTGTAAVCRALPDGVAALDLSWNQLDAVALANLPPSLEALELSHGELEDGVVFTLACWPGRKLNWLGLGSNRLTDAGIAALFALPAVQELEGLDLSHNRLTDTTADRLLDSPLAQRLRVLMIFGNDLSPEAMARLRKGLRGLVA